MKQGTLTVIYDDNCLLCREIVARMIDNRDSDRFSCIPCDSPERKKRFPEMKDEDCASAIQAIRPDGTTVTGDMAIREILSWHGRWARLALFLKLPIFRTLFNWGYRLVARWRYQISSLLSASRKN